MFPFHLLLVHDVVVAEQGPGSVHNDFSGEAHIVIQARDISGGVHIGDVNLVTGVPVQTRYREQVKRIAPQHLIGREPELAELVEFCTSPTAGAYSWWRAPAWSGKSALMSTFVLDPPAGVRVVSFFVTARWSAQNDRTAFIDNVMEQLLALLGEGLPPFLTESTREAHLLGLLDDAARACQGRGERLVLLVDGLDEDRGVHVGADSYSIAALLPDRPPSGMRVIVAGRPSPPIPADVPPQHPLRDATIVRTLAPSPQAQAIRVEMERELKNLLHGAAAEQDLLGLVAVAGGGLSAVDLADLTGLAPYQVDDCLRTVTGRSFAHRDSHYLPGEAPDVFVLGHEDLQVTALEMLGPARLEGYRQRLHTWAERYRARRWPPGTPEYLLRGYYSMLVATGDIEMVSCATDPARQDRMLDVSGGDAAALAEITTALDAIAVQEQPDLLAMVRLAIHRDHLSDRNSNIPPNLPAVWAILGQPNRAESLANSITDLSGRVEALVAVAAMVAEGGDLGRASVLLDRAEAVARTITDPHYQGWALVAVAKAVAANGDLDRAEAAARSITDHRSQARALIAVAATLTGDRDRAAVLLDRAEAVAGAAPTGFHQAHALREVAAALADDRGRAGALLERAEAVAREITERTDQARALEFIAEAVAANGDLDRAEAIARSITEPAEQERALGSVAGAVAGTGDLDRAEAIARTSDRYGRMWASVAMVEAVAGTGDLDRAEAIARTITEPWHQGQALIAVVRAVAGAGDPDRAQTIARTITDSRCQVWALVAVTAVVTGSGDLDSVGSVLRTITEPDRLQVPVLASVARAAATAGDHTNAADLLDRAETLARTITEPALQAPALASVAHAAATVGDHAHAIDLLDRAEALARTITNRVDHSQRLLVPKAKAIARSGDVDRAEAIARTITSPRLQTEALRAVAEAAARADDLDRAEAIAATITNPSHDQTPELMHVFDGDQREVDAFLDERGMTLRSVAAAAARNGDLDRALATVRTITNPDNHAWALRAIAVAAARLGDVDRAEAIAHTITEPLHQVWAFIVVAEARADVGDHARATDLLNRAEAATRTITRPNYRMTMFDNVATAAAHCGNPGRALAIVHTTIHPDHHGWTLQSIAAATADLGDLDRAEAIAHTITDPHPHAHAVAATAKAAASTGDHTRATDLLDRAEAIADTIAEPDQQVRALVSTAEATASTGDHARASSLLDRAEAIARTIAEADKQRWALRSVAEQVAKDGDLDRAEAITATIADPRQRAEALMALADKPSRRRARTIAQVLKLSQWHQAAPLLIEMSPEALTGITEELTIVSRADALT